MPSQAVNAKPPIFSDTSLANTWAKDQRNAPDKIKMTPNNFPSRLGFPERIPIPINAMINPIIFLSGVFSPNKKYAIRIPNGISACTKSVADAPSRIFNP